MASTSTGPSCPIILITQTAYPLPTQKYMIPMNWKRFQLSQLVNKSLSLSRPVPFDFLIRGEVLRTSLAEWCAENGVGEEETLEVEYMESVMPPQKMTDIPHEDWVSSVSCSMQGHFLTGSYDGILRAFDYSKNVQLSAHAHSAPITSVCVVPSLDNAVNGDKPYLVATASQDLSAQLAEVSLSADPSKRGEFRTLAKLHLHTGPVSSVVSDQSGSHILTSSWDTLIGLWDTSIPTSDEVSEPPVAERERKKRRKLNGVSENKPKRKAPTAVLKSHTARVSRVIFGRETHVAYSCGFDSTVRLWDIENGVCTQTISASEKPFLDISLTTDGNTVAAASTDRTITLYDVRTNDSSNVTSSLGCLPHPATPSSLASGGGYDGVVRMWDLRSTKSAMTSFKTWDGHKKVLSVAWKRGIVGIGGEGGLEVWKTVEETRG
ncbi:WD40 repeat-like protein [Marasmius fiardii PR-910]|nr:WD40 repeat-like protein [Marasmius fiardii PR-910]